MSSALISRLDIPHFPFLTYFLVQQVSQFEKSTLNQPPQGQKVNTARFSERDGPLISALTAVDPAASENFLDATKVKPILDLVGAVESR